MRVGVRLQAMLDAYIKASAAKQAMVSQRLATLERVLVKLHPSAADAFAPLSAVRGMQSSLLGSDSSLGEATGNTAQLPPFMCKWNAVGFAAGDCCRQPAWQPATW